MAEVVPPLLKIKEVARYLGVHYHTVQRIPAADLPYVIISTRGDRRYELEDVQSYIRALGERGPTMKPNPHEHRWSADPNLGLPLDTLGCVCGATWRPGQPT